MRLQVLSRVTQMDVIGPLKLVESGARGHGIFLVQVHSPSHVAVGIPFPKVVTLPPTKSMEASHLHEASQYEVTIHC